MRENNGARSKNGTVKRKKSARKTLFRKEGGTREHTQTAVRQREIRVTGVLQI